MVTAINPTPAGEGKTTISIGLTQALNKIGKKAIVALREPSLGPCFGVKGGAAGGGYSQVVPMEDMNLHFTGDFHAITSANNLLAAMLDNHIQQGNELRIDTRNIVWKRCIDMNDRVLRNVVVGLGAKADGVVREDHFVITVASEIMAILCLCSNIRDLKERLGKIIVAYNMDGEPVTAADLKAVGAMAALLKDAIKPNVIQTLEHTPALVHGGPFANIAHGCNSVKATKMALKLSDIAVTEAGFGADLGAEKFMDIKCRAAGLKPDAVVIVATVKALKYNGGVKKDELAVINEYKNGIDTIISEPDKGMYEAINKGIRAATGDIIGLIHSDDFLFSSHTISEIVKTFEEQDADMIYGNGVFVDYDDTNQMIRNWISGRYSKENVKNGWLPLHPTVYIKKECMDKWGLYNESYKIAADSDLLVRYLYEADLKVYYLNKYIVKMRMGGLSTDAGKSKLKWAEDLRMYKSHGIKPISALKGKILSKIPQFIEARLPWSEIPEAEEESLIQPDAANKKE